MESKMNSNEYSPSSDLQMEKQRRKKKNRTADGRLASEKQKKKEEERPKAHNEINDDDILFVGLGREMVAKGTGDLERASAGKAVLP